MKALAFVTKHAPAPFVRFALGTKLHGLRAGLNLMLDSGWHTNRAPTWYLNWVSLTFDLIVVTTLFMLAWLLVTATGGEIDLPGDSIFLTRFEVVSIVLLLGIMKTLQRRAAEFNQYRSSRRSTEKTQQPGFHDAATGKVLAEFQDEISGNPTINELGDAIARSSSRVLEFDRISIIALDLGNGASSLMYALGGSATVWAPGERHVLPVGLKTALQVLSANRDGTILTRKELIRIGDINPTVYEIIPTWGDLNSVIAIPLVSASDEPIALLFYLSFSRKQFHANELALAKAVGELASPVVHRDFVVEEYKTNSLEMAAAAEIGKVLNSDSINEKSVNRVADIVRTVIPFDQMSVVVASNAGTFSEFSSQPNSEPTLVDPKTHSLIPESLGDVVVSTGQPLMLNRWSRQALKVQVPVGLRAVEQRDINGALLVPLKVKGTLIGLITLLSHRGDLYDEASLALLSNLATYLSAPMRSAVQEAEADALVTRRRVLASISEIASRAVDIESLFSQALQESEKILEFDSARAIFVDQESPEIELVFSTGSSHDTSLSGDGLSTDEAILTMISSTGRPAKLEGSEIALWRQYLYSIDDSSAIPVNSVMIVPIEWNDDLVGVIVFQSAAHNAYFQKELKTADEIAARVSASVASIRMRRTVDRDVLAIDVLDDIYRIATSSTAFESKMHRIVARAKEIIPLDELAVQALDPDDENLRGTVTTSASGASRQIKDLFQMARSSGELVNVPRPKLAQSTVNEPGESDSIEMKPVSALVFPMQWHRERLGFAALISNEIPRFRKDHEKVARQIISSLAAAIANERLSERTSELNRERAQSQKLVQEKERLEQLERERDRFVSTVSHELRTPLTVITAFSNILAQNKAGGIGKRELKHVSLIQKNARRLDLLISDLFDTSKIQSGQFDLTFSEFALRDLLNETAQSMAPTFAEKDQDFTMDDPPASVWLKADRNRLSQVLINLLSNSSKYSPDSALVEMRWTLDEETISFQVMDRGPGISEEVKERLFTPFYRVDNQMTREVSGTGLGLYVAKSICDHHSGSIDFENRPEGGSIFTVRIPGLQIGPSDDWLAAQLTASDLPEPHSRLYS